MNRYIQDRLPIFTFVIIVFILGISFGAVAVKTVDYSTKEDVFSYFNKFLQGYRQIEYRNTALLAESIEFNLMNIFIIWAFGLSMILMPLITILIFFKGFVLGFTVGFLISEYSFRGILIALAAVFPQNILVIPVYLIASVLSIYISINIFKYYRGKAAINGEIFLKYSLEMLVMAVILVLSSLIEAYLSPLLLNLVSRLF